MTYLGASLKLQPMLRRALCRTADTLHACGLHGPAAALVNGPLAQWVYRLWAPPSGVTVASWDVQTGDFTWR